MAYKAKAEFFLVYIREAHPARKTADGPRQRDRRGGLEITQPESVEERALVASKCLRDLKLTLPCLIDTMEGDFLKPYGGYPAGTVVIDRQGTVRFSSRGPGGARPKDAEKVLKELLAKEENASKPSETPAGKDAEDPTPDAPKAAPTSGD